MLIWQKFRGGVGGYCTLKVMIVFHTWCLLSDLMTIMFWWGLILWWFVGNLWMSQTCWSVDNVVAQSRMPCIRQIPTSAEPQIPWPWPWPSPDQPGLALCKTKKIKSYVIISRKFYKSPLCMLLLSHYQCQHNFRQISLLSSII